MSREDQPEGRRLSLGACDCPGSPHDTERTTALVLTVVKDPQTGLEEPAFEEQEVTGDWADVVERLDYGTLRYIGSAYANDDTGLVQARQLQRGISAWNLTDEEGRPLHINIPSIDKLRLRQSQILVGWLDQPKYRRFDVQAATEVTPPNGSSGSSANGHREPRASRRSTAKTQR